MAGPTSRPLTTEELMAFRTAVCRRMRWVARARQRLITRGVADGDDVGRLTWAAEAALHDLQIGLHYAAVAEDRKRVKVEAEPAAADAQVLPVGTESGASWKGHRGKGRR